MWGDFKLGKLLNQFAIRNSQFAITFCDGDLNPQTLLNTLRYIHANPKTAGVQQGFFYDFSNYGINDRLSNDGITQ